jgi:hypothetical protein
LGKEGRQVSVFPAGIGDSRLQTCIWPWNLTVKKGGFSEKNSRKLFLSTNKLIKKFL